MTPPDSSASSADSRPAALTRRALLQGAGLFIAAAALPAERARAQEEGSAAPAAPIGDPTVMPKLSAYMSEAAGRDIPADVAELTKYHILDTIAAMVSGVALLPGKAATKFAQVYGGSQVATIVGTKLLAGPMEAAMTNAMLAHSDETDDSQPAGRSHPGTGVVPAALAACETFGGDGTRMIRAVTLGYDIGTRLTITLGKDYIMTRNHKDTHQIANDFGCAAAAGCVAGFSAQQMRWVLDYAAQQAGGITAWQRDTQHIEKSLCFAGFAARNGITTALLLSTGATGVDDIFSGADNYFLANAPDAKVSDLLDKLGERYEVTRTDIKKWTVGSPIQAALDALYNIQKEKSFTADDVKHVVVRVGTSGAAIVDNRTMPDICMQHMIAIMLIDKTASFQAAHDKARMKDPEVLRQRAKVELIPDPALEKFYPQRQGIVEVTFNDGTTVKNYVKAVRGAAKNPMGRDEVATKANDLMSGPLGADKAKRLIDTVLSLEKVSDIRSLRPLLQTA